MSAEGAASGRDEGIAWEYRIWLTNRFLLWDLIRVMLIAIVAGGLLVGLMGLTVEGEFVTIPLYGLGIVIAVLIGLYLIAVVVMGLRYRAMFAVTPRGVSYSSGSREKGALRSVVAIGALAGSASTAGAGLLAAARDGAITEWSEICKVVVHRRHGVVIVRNSWRAVQRLWVPPELLDSVVEAVQTYWDAAGGQVDIVEK